MSLDTFICVHYRDLEYLFELALGSYLKNFLLKNELIIISNDKAVLIKYLKRKNLLHIPSKIYEDTDILNSDEQKLPRWYRQQIIKLKAYKFCSTDYFCNLGADTIFLQPVGENDLFHDGKPILYYNRYPETDSHLKYERRRIEHVAKILQLEPLLSRLYVDFIFDFFCFDRKILSELNNYLISLYGQNCYYHLLKDISDCRENRVRFGEWTLYSVFALDYLKANIVVRNSESRYLRQIHNPRVLATYNFDSKIAHFVDKHFDVDYIVARIVAKNQTI